MIRPMGWLMSTKGLIYLRIEEEKMAREVVIAAGQVGSGIGDDL
jgi:hypothetical protein